MREEPNRAPHERLDDDYLVRFNKTCRRKTHHENGCIHADGKSIWRPDRCEMAGVHYCEKLVARSKTYFPLITELRENHYAFRSREHVENLNDLLKKDKVPAFEGFDKTWFSSRLDPMPHRIINDVARALHVLLVVIM